MIINEDLAIITPHLNKNLLQRIKDICYLKYLLILLSIEERHLKVELGFIDYYFNYVIQLKMPNLLDKLDV